MTVQVLARRASLSTVATTITGELAVVAAIEILKRLQPIEELLADFPDLAALYELHSTEVAAIVEGMEPHYTRVDKTQTASEKIEERMMMPRDTSASA
jgi:ParB-like chromosome segregation protein Spo0J